MHNQDQEKKQPGLYQSPADGSKALFDDYQYWTGKITEHSFQLSIGVLAANWAVFPSVQTITSHRLAVLSVLVVLATLLANLVGCWVMGELHNCQMKKAERDHEAWKKEFETTKSTNAPWPFTRGIEQTGALLRAVKVLGPVIAFILLLLALL